MKDRNKVAIVIVLLVSVLLVLFLNRLMMPKYATDLFEGALIGEYYQSGKNHELLIIGDCEVYENISTVTLWQNYGITSYIRGSPQQLMWQSYYLLEDALKYETPDAVLFSVYAMKYSEPMSEAYNRLTLDGMRPGISKIRSVKASMTQGESFLSYFFPLLRYHERWRELTADDLRFFFSTPKVAHSGFTMRCDVLPLGSLPSAHIPGDFTFDDICFQYLDKARILCENRGIDFILFKAPVMYPHWFEQWDEQIVRYAGTHGLTYINALDVIDDIGLDFSADTYNGGLHLNVWGAEKMADYLGGILVSRGLGRAGGDPEISAAWAQIVRNYEDMKSKQIYEIETYGRVMTFVIDN